MKIFTQVSLLLLLWHFTFPAHAAKLDAEQAFKQLTALVGTWKGRFSDGREHSVNYRLTAGGTVLVETWTLSKVRESMTFVPSGWRYRDGNALLSSGQPTAFGTGIK